MTTVFLVTLRPILILSKCIGLIDISYTMEPTGLLVRNMNSTFPAVLEIVRMIVLLTIVIHLFILATVLSRKSCTSNYRYHEILDYYHRSQTFNNMDNQVSIYFNYT